MANDNEQRWTWKMDSANPDRVVALVAGDGVEIVAPRDDGDWGVGLAVDIGYSALIASAPTLAAKARAWDQALSAWITFQFDPEHLDVCDFGDVMRELQRAMPPRAPGPRSIEDKAYAFDRLRALYRGRTCENKSGRETALEFDERSGEIIRSYESASDRAPAPKGPRAIAEEIVACLTSEFDDHMEHMPGRPAEPRAVDRIAEIIRKGLAATR